MAEGSGAEIVLDPTWRQIVDAEKVVASKRFRSTVSSGSVRLRVKVSCPQLPGKCMVYVRLLQQLVENYSCILTYQPPFDEPIRVLRVNGPHGGHRNPDGRVLFVPHLHRARPAREHVAPTPRLKIDHALDLEPRYRSLVFGWDLFCRTIKLAPHKRLAEVIGEMYSEVAQGTFDDPFAAPDN